jgi:hypothetical protein
LLYNSGRDIDLQKALTERFSHLTKLFFVGITPILYLKLEKTSLHCTNEQAGKSFKEKLEAASKICMIQ